VSGIADIGEDPSASGVYARMCVPGLCSRRLAEDGFSRHHNEAQAAEAVIIELDEARLDQIDGLLVPVVHLGDTPPAHDARTLGHATRVSARGAAAFEAIARWATRPPMSFS
jgi:hypothetical protein